jgi:hypothetical protein
VRSSYEQGSQQAGRPSGPQILATLLTRLRLATTLRMGALQLESPKCGVCFDIHREVFIGANGTPTDLDKLIWCHVVAGWPRRAAGRPCGSASTDSGFSSSCRCVATKARGKPPQTLAMRPAPGPLQPGVWSTRSTCQIHPYGDDDFDIWSTSLCHPLKCSNLLPKFLKNKH